MKPVTLKLRISDEQRGVVLFFALIALVAMSLAAVALIRSVDTNSIIAGNLAFKQTALISSDRGVETAIDWLDGKTSAELNSHSEADGYFATFDTLDLNDPDTLKDNDTWENSAFAAGADIADGNEATTGNTIRYIIQRMCRQTSEPTDEHCLLGGTQTETGSRGVKDSTGAGAIIEMQQSPMYRITTRVDGPRNTVSYAQTFVY